MFTFFLLLALLVIAAVSIVGTIRLVARDGYGAVTSVGGRRSRR